MISALISFFGGTAFRMLWGEVSSFLNKRQDHKFEIERLALQAKMDAEQHARNLEAIKVQAELGVQTIRVAAEGEVDKIAAEAYRDAVRATTMVTGFWLVDSWNAAIRPGVATWAVVMLTLSELAVLTMSDTTAQVCFAALGIYLADRTLGKRGK